MKPEVEEPGGKTGATSHTLQLPASPDPWLGAGGITRRSPASTLAQHARNLPFKTKLPSKMSGRFPGAREDSSVVRVVLWGASRSGKSGMVLLRGIVQSMPAYNVRPALKDIGVVWWWKKGRRTTKGWATPPPPTPTTRDLVGGNGLGQLVYDELPHGHISSAQVGW